MWWIIGAGVVLMFIGSLLPYEVDPGAMIEIIKVQQKYMDNDAREPKRLI